MHADSGTQRKLGRIIVSGVAASVMLAGACALAGPAGAIPSPSDYTLSFFAGNGDPGSPAPGPATSSAVNDPYDVARDAAGNIYIADDSAHVVDKVTPSGALSVVAGNGQYNGTTVPGPATATQLGSPRSVAVDAAGNLFIVDNSGPTVDKVTPDGQLSIVAGITGQRDTSQTLPTPGLATSTALDGPFGVAVDSAGNIYVSDTELFIIDKITPAGHLTVFAGHGTAGGHAPVPGPATSSPLYYPAGLAVDGSRNLYVADQYNNDVEKITPGGTLSVLAGEGPDVYTAPTPGPAVDSSLSYPNDVTVDNLGDVYIADSYNDLVEKITPGGTLSIIAGDGTNNAGTPGPSLQSSVGTPYGITVDPDGNLYVTDEGHRRVYQLALNASAPTAPTDVHGTRGADGAATVHFSPPLRTGQSPITGYQYSTDGGTSWHAAIVTGAAPNLSVIIPGLAADRTYHLKLRAVNALGDGPAASTTLTVPARPTPPKHKPWYVDPLSHTTRAHLAAVPKHPARTHGKARLTTAAYRTHNGALAVPAGRAHGHQLTTGQAVQAVNLFAFDSAKLTATGRKTLRRLATSLRHVHHITCEGYADYAGRTPHEKALSTRRATAVCTALRHDRHGLRTHAVGYGATRPVVIGGTPTQRAANRRVDIRATR